MRGISDAVPGNRQLQVFIFVQAFRWPTLPATMRACAGHAKVAELVDALDLGSSAARRGGSSPPFRTSAGLSPP